MALNGSEGRVEALESQLARLEGMKRDLEYKLASIHSSLRRSLGFRQENYVDGRSLRPRSTSPRRRPQSPAKGLLPFYFMYAAVVATAIFTELLIPNLCFPGFDNTYTTTTDGRGSPIPRTGSPDRTRSRSTSPNRRPVSPSRAALEESTSAAADLDPEAVRIALREYVTLMANTERERDDAIAQVNTLKSFMARFVN